MAQPSWIIKYERRQQRAAVTDFEQFIDLFLIFHQRKPDVCIGDGEYALGAHRILVQRNRDRSE